MGLDLLRGKRIAALAMTGGAALLGAAWGRRKLGATLGAGVVCYFGYLSGFIQLELQPTHDPGGGLEPLYGSALVHTSFIMLALAFLGGFTGAAVGVALGEVLLNPPYRLARFIWRRSTPAQTGDASHEQRKEAPGHHTSNTKTIRATISSWLV